MWLLSAAAEAATVTFQGRSYNVQVVALATTFTVAANSDLIFVQTPLGQKLLALPTDAQARGDYNPTNQLFYMLDRTSGQVNVFTTINATLINLDGTLNTTTQQNPLTGQQVIGRPIDIPSAQTIVDVCIIDQSRIGYRTDGPTASAANVYTVTPAGQVSGAAVAAPVKNADAGNGNASVFVAYDASTGNYLLSQVSLDPAQNSDTRDRIIALPLGGSASGALILENNAALPTYTKGGELGITVDQSTAAIYLLSVTGSSSQIFVFSPQQPGLTNIRPASGTILGGTQIKITGVSLPPDAAVFLGGVAASNVSVTGGTTITALTPAHAQGVVDVTVTGTGIAASAPLTLSGAFTYVTTPPLARLSASPSQGLPPLTVSFSVAGSAATNGTLVNRVIDFGDSTSFAFPADLNVATTSHTYAAIGTYIAVLTVRDDQGGASSDSAVIIVGEGADLVLRSLSLKASRGKTSTGAMNLTGEIVLPENTVLAGAVLVAGFVNPNSGTLVDPQPPGFVQNAAVDANGTATGGEVSAWLDSRSSVSNGFARFSIRPLKTPGTAPNTYTLSFGCTYEMTRELTADTLDMYAALGNAVVNLFKHADGTALQPDELQEKRVGSVLVIVRFDTKAGETLQYRKVAVVNISPSKGNNMTLQLTRP
ncbi:MAG: PKD domain-containing protein [Planctomycetota bacterium]